MQFHIYRFIGDGRLEFVRSAQEGLNEADALNRAAAVGGVYAPYFKEGNKFVVLPLGNGRPGNPNGRRSLFTLQQQLSPVQAVELDELTAVW